MRVRPRPRTDHEHRIVSVFASERNFLTVAQVRDRLTSTGSPIRLATVYQCVKRLLEAGVLERATLRSSTAVYGLRTACGRGHRLMCSECALVVNADDDEVTTWVAQTAARHGFMIADSSVLLSGTCATCAPPLPATVECR